MRAAFDLPSPARLHLGPDGRHVWALSRAAGAVRLIDTGRVTEDHGDHEAVVLHSPALTDAALSGEVPVHFNTGGGRAAIFWDGTGTATLHDAEGRATLAVLETGKPHHGVAVPVGAGTILTVAPEGEGLPDALALVDAEGAEVLRIDCLNLHGEGKAGPFIAFGCEDGVAIFDTAAIPPAARFVPYPADAPQGGMIRQLLSPRATLALVGNFGPDHLVVLDPTAGDGDFRFTALPAPRMAFALTGTGEVGFAILADGRLLRFSALTGAILAEAPEVTAAYAMDRSVIRPMIAVAGDRVAISDPARGAVVLVDAGDLAVIECIAIGGAPRRSGGGGCPKR
ncbi:hypothetical protein [Rubellimicrobium sp. CFH 75288]|uniref:hypothetical protein n=1 Tax=Rubellimicrobium sp. CFH 75288 TaxID=2697034 RepID=UPI00141309B8|nr:hypothetical protein [Rubellimicrobium sp. CFH 75288]NAZ38278.1 hypothetical protein [Rubellimicrobium sp. CFH 75288]